MTNDPRIKIHLNKIENRTTFIIKIGTYLERLTPETMKLFGNVKLKITKGENGQYVPYLKITKLISVHCNVVNNDCQQNSRVFYILFCQFFCF